MINWSSLSAHRARSSSELYQNKVPYWDVDGSVLLQKKRKKMKVRLARIWSQRVSQQVHVKLSMHGYNQACYYTRSLAYYDKINNFKLVRTLIQPTPSQMALMMICTFTKEEEANGTPTGTTTSSDKRRIKTVQKLNPMIRSQSGYNFVSMRWQGDSDQQHI